MIVTHQKKISKGILEDSFEIRELYLKGHYTIFYKSIEIVK